MPDAPSLFVRPGRFLGATGPEEISGRYALYGMPFDSTVSFRPGARFGPSAVREASWGLEEYSPVFRGSLGDVGLVDAGDVDLPPGNGKGAVERTEAAVGQLLDRGLVPVGLGGEHLCSLGAIRAAHARYPSLVVVQLDAHADLREEYLGERWSHATVMRRAREIVGRERLIQVGIRSGERGEWEQVNRLVPHPEGLPQVLDWCQDSPVYLTVDIDVVDPAFAPGTGTPEPGGWTSGELLAAVSVLSRLHLVGWDVVEVLPEGDVSRRTALLAARFVRDLLIAHAGRDRA